MPHKAGNNTPLEVVHPAPEFPTNSSSKGFTEQTPLALLLSPSSQSSDDCDYDYDHTGMMDDDGMKVKLDELIQATTTTPVEVKPLPKIRLDLCPVPREEDEDQEKEKEDDEKDEDDQQLKQIYSSPSTFSNSARTKSIGSSSRAQWHTIDSIDQDMYPLGGLVGRGRSQRSSGPVSEVHIISKAAAQDSRQRRNSDRRRHRNGKSSTRSRLFMCGSGGINLNEKEVKDSIHDVKATLRQIFTTNLETLNVIKKSVQEAYLHYYHNSNSSNENHCDSGKATSNREGRQQVKDEYYYMNKQSKTMSLSTVNDDDDYGDGDNKSCSDLAEENVMVHDDNHNTSGLEFEEEQFEPVEFDARRLV